MKIRTWGQSAMLAGLLTAAVCPLLSTCRADLKDAIPNDVFLAIHAQHNPERDYMKSHYDKVWQTVQDTGIIDKFTKAVQNQMDSGDVEQMLQVTDSLKAAMAPIDWESLSNVQETAVGMRMRGPFSQQVVMMRFPNSGAEGLNEAVGNLFALAEQASGGKLTIGKLEVEGMKLQSLVIPGDEVPFSPTVGIRDDLFLFSTDAEIATEALGLLANPSGESKFDDIRVTAALSKLPAAEDSMIFFDGQALQAQLQGVIAFIEANGAGDEDALRIAALLDEIREETDIVDHELTVQYTDGFRNLFATYGKSTPNAGEKVLGKMMTNKTVEDWASFVPKDANGFSVGSGASLHPLYEWVTTRIPEMFPESKQAMDRLEAMESQFDVYLDRDILTNMTGEYASISIPGPRGPMGPMPKTVSMMKCSDPDRLNELIGRAMDQVQQIPQVKQQGFKIKPVEGMDGFSEISMTMLMMMGGMRPTYGFDGDWMTMGSSPDAIRTVKTTMNGEAPNFTESEAYSNLKADVKGEVFSVSFENTGENIRNMANQLQQAGMMLPMVLGAAGGQGGPDLQKAQEFISLLPSVSRVMKTMDFMETTFTYTEPGDEDGTYMRHVIMTVREPEA